MYFHFLVSWFHGLRGNSYKAMRVPENCKSGYLSLALDLHQLLFYFSLKPFAKAFNTSKLSS